jgi:hypothetical protein
MSVRSRWERLDAEHWIWVLGLLQTTALSLLTLWVAYLGVLAGLVLAAVFPALLTGASGAWTSAWRRDKAWAWWVGAIGCALGLVIAPTRWVAHGASWPSVAGAVLNAVLLVLLAHPDSRARLRRGAADPGVAATPAPPGRIHRPGRS